MLKPSCTAVSIRREHPIISFSALARALQDPGSHLAAPLALLNKCPVTMGMRGPEALVGAVLRGWEWADLQLRGRLRAGEGASDGSGLN